MNKSRQFNSEKIAEKHSSEYDSVLPVSVIVLAKNSCDTLEECLDSIAKNKPTEIIVVDGGSTDNTVQLASQYTEKILYDGGKGKSHARNLGADASISDYVAYVDSDMVIPGTALSVMLGEIRDSEATAVSSLARFRKTSNLSYWSWAEGMHLLRWYRTRLRSGSYLGTQCCLVRRSVLLSYKFETRFGEGMDDVDMQFRLLKDGHNLGISSVVSTHIKNQSFREFIAYRIYMGKVRKRYFRRYRIRYMKYFPLSMETYWILVSVVSGRSKLIPYHAVNGIAQTLGFLTGR